MEIKRKGSSMTGEVRDFTIALNEALFDTSLSEKARISRFMRRVKRLMCYHKGGKYPRYEHTGVEPKRQNRTRKKQRLTRLQRRAKRQC